MSSDALLPSGAEMKASLEEVLAKDDRPSPAPTASGYRPGPEAPKAIAAWSYKRRQYGQTAEAVA